MKQRTTNEIRQMWLDFFKEKRHKVEESASLIPNNDPTLLWINAGVAPLKKYFDGRVIPNNPRIVNAQKCLRTNDIDNVGKTARHHTFFEMLGNFSIGDYFRDDIIPWAHELLFDEKYFGFDKEDIYITVYPDDNETYNAWKKVGIDESHLIYCEHNFWEIGEGPCGPDTEIFFDRGKDYGPFDLSLIEHDIENDRFIEIWNIVFSQFNAKQGIPREDYKELPSKNIDTGAGLERLACIVQGVETNFETDTFMHVIKEIETISNTSYAGQMSFKVIVDHIRTVTFAIHDGALLSNEGRGYVLRRLLRRAVKHGVQLGIDEPFLYRLVSSVIEAMGEFYTTLKDKQKLIEKIVRIEEEKFLETLASGEEKLYQMMKESNSSILSGKDAFTLYDTYGFPLELTKEIAEERGFTVDHDGFKIEMSKQKDRARNARKHSISMNNQNPEYIAFTKESTFVGYDTLNIKTTVLKVFDEGIVLQETPFYAESGGQVADLGVIILDNQAYEVTDVQKLPNGQFIHLMDSAPFNDGDTVQAKVDEYTRSVTMKNHSATHLLFAVLRDLLGEHVSQQGSLVSHEHLRFDFNHFESLADDTILKIEKKVNDLIQTSQDVEIKNTDIDEAKKMGAIAEFGEKYDDSVRVINMGHTIDLCGGTHVENISDIDRFAIASIESKGSGIYRILGHANDSIVHLKNQFTGFYKEMDKLDTKVDRLLEEAKENNIELQFTFERNATFLGSYQDIINIRRELHSYTNEVHELQKELKEKLKEQTFEDMDQFLSRAIGNKLILKLENIDKDALKPLVDRLLDQLGEGFVFIANVMDKKVTFIAKTNLKEYHAGNIAKQAAIATGGNGGGRPTMAQAGGRDVSKVDDAIQIAKDLLL